MREWSTFSRFPCDADEYYTLMLDGPFQEKLHLQGLGMDCWDFTDNWREDGTLKRVVFSEPRLNLPSIIAKMISKAQAYHEHTVYTPSERRRLVRVVPCVGGENMDFTFDEWVRPDEDGVGGCFVEATVKVTVGVLRKGSTTERKSNWLCRILERFICSTSKVKVAERDAWLNRHFTSLGYRVFGDVQAGAATASAMHDGGGSSSGSSSGGDDVVVELDFDGGDVKVSGKGEFSSSSSTSSPSAAAAAAAAAALGSHPLPPSTFKRSSWKAIKSSVAMAVSA